MRGNRHAGHGGSCDCDRQICEYPDRLKSSHGADWEDIAQQETTFRVLSNEGQEIPTAEFRATGEEDVASLLSAAATVVGHDIPLTSCLDFGCGVGRLTLPLARRAGTVLGCDIAPAMLAHARRSADEAGLSNVAFSGDDRLLTLPDGQFSFICSLLVFQYIPRSLGYDIVRTLLRLLAPGGVAILQLVLAPPGEALRQLVRVSRAKSYFGLTPGEADRNESETAGMQIHLYDEDVIYREVEAAAARVLARLPTRLGEITSAVLIIRKEPARETAC